MTTDFASSVWGLGVFVALIMIVTCYSCHRINSSGELCACAILLFRNSHFDKIKNNRLNRICKVIFIFVNEKLWNYVSEYFDSISFN